MSNESYQKTAIRSGDELKIYCLNISTNIIMGAKAAIMSNEKYNRELFGWGALIESFDSFIGIYYQQDDLYYKTRKSIKVKISRLNPNDSSIVHKLKIKRLYDLWFRLICVKLAKFKIFPPLPVSYAQGIGEITEELRLIVEKDRDA